MSNWEKLRNFLSPRSLKNKRAKVSFVGTPERSLDMRKIKMNVQGKVQGVGFRQNTKTVADKIGVKGFVRNEENGDVYCEAMGTSEQIEVFIQKVKESPSPFGRVDHLTIEEDSSIKESNEFTITY